jgi:ethanolamine transporter EutH
MQSFTDLVGHTLRLHPDGFRMLASGQVPAWWGVLIALLAALSQGVGHAFILFVNRVTPLRFALSLVVEAVLLVAGFLFWALSSWLVARLVFAVPVRPAAVVLALGVAHAPQLLAFLGALPYLGVPWLTLLSLWTAVAFVVALMEVAGLGSWQAFTALLGGWLVMLLLQRRAGQPLMRLGRALLNRTAGVQLVHDRRALRDLLASGPAGRPPR